MWETHSESAHCFQVCNSWHSLFFCWRFSNQRCIAAGAPFWIGGQVPVFVVRPHAPNRDARTVTVRYKYMYRATPNMHVYVCIYIYIYILYIILFNFVNCILSCQLAQFCHVYADTVLWPWSTLWPTSQQTCRQSRWWMNCWWICWSCSCSWGWKGNEPVKEPVRRAQPSRYRTFTL